MIKLICFFILSASIGNTFTWGTTFESRIVFPQKSDSSEESSEESSNKFNTNISPKLHTTQMITFRESEQDFIANPRHDAPVWSSLDTVNRNNENHPAESNFEDNLKRITSEHQKRRTIERQHDYHGQDDNVDGSYRGTLDFVMPNNDKKSMRNSESRIHTTTSEKPFYFEAISDENSSQSYQDNIRRPSTEITNYKRVNAIDNNDQNSQRRPSKAASKSRTTPEPLQFRESSSNRSEKYVPLDGSSAQFSSLNKKKHKRKKHRLCEQKYMEYMVRIFRDEDTVADGSDADFDGRVLVEPGEYPHMTALGYSEPDQPIDYKCGGSLISENFVVTAAHCTNLTGQAPERVRIGDLNLMKEERYLEPQIRKIRRIFVHPEYRSNLYYNDIALLELDESVEFTEFVRPIRLWIDMALPENTTAHAMGYGATAFGKAPTHRLTDMNLTIVPNDVCNADMPEIPETPAGIISSQICARDYVMNRDTCQGDSGGPLQLNLRGRRRRSRKHYHLIGITSYGLVCRSNYPSVYTRVSEFLDWIEQIVWQQ